MPSGAPAVTTAGRQTSEKPGPADRSTVLVREDETACARGHTAGHEEELPVDGELVA